MTQTQNTQIKSKRRVTDHGEVFTAEREVDATVAWRCRTSISTGDTVYLYLGVPKSEIVYRCTVISEDISECDLCQYEYTLRDKHSNKKFHYVILKVEKQYLDHKLSFRNLLDNGLSSVQCQMRVSKELAEYINSQT